MTIRLREKMEQSVFYSGKAYTVSSEPRDPIFIEGTITVVDWDSNERGTSLFVTLNGFETMYTIDPSDFDDAVCKRDGHRFTELGDEDGSLWNYCMNCGYEEYLGDI